MKKLALVAFLLAPFTQPLQAQQGCTVPSLVDPSTDPSGYWSLPAKIAFVGYNGVSTGEVQQALGPWRNVCQSSLPSISYGGNPDHYSSDTEIWTVHRGTSEEIGMVNPPEVGCAEADLGERKIRLPTVSGH